MTNIVAGNSIGKNFVLTTCGESHGIGLMAIVDGCIANMDLSEKDLQYDLDRRKPGNSKYTTQRKEPDTVEIISGVFNGKTTGTSIGLLILNQDQKSKDYEDIKNKFRPGHADYTYFKKYGIYDYRGGGRASARETAMRVAAGAIAKKILKQQGIEIYGYCSKIGPLDIIFDDKNEINNNEFFIPNTRQIVNCQQLIKDIRKQQDSIGAQVTVIAKGIPVGLGSPVFNRLDADIAGAMMGINAVKGVEIGDGFNVVEQKGSYHRDEITTNGMTSNHAGGVLGGISSGQDIVIKLAFKPTSSIAKPGNTITKDTATPCQIVTKGRHDPCVGIRGVPVAEAMLALLLVDHMLDHKAHQQLSCYSS